MTDGNNGDLGADPRTVGTDWVPRDPAAYSPSNHYEERRDDMDRFINDGWAVKCIRHGSAEPSADGTWRFRVDAIGLSIDLICGLGDGLVPVIATGYARVDEPHKAVEAGGFPERRVWCARLRNVVSDERRFGNHIRHIQVRPPTKVDGHRVITRKGEPYVACADCDRDFSQRSNIKRHRCD